MTDDFKFPFRSILLRAMAYFVVAVLLILLWSFVSGQGISVGENDSVEIAQSIALILTAFIAAFAFKHTDRKLLKVACLILACIALVALMRETQSCSSDTGDGFCLNRNFKHVLMALFGIAAIAGTVVYSQTIKDNFASLMTPATLWPGFVILALMLLSQLLENLDGSHNVMMGVDHGFVYLEEFSELFGALFSTSLAVHFYKRAKGTDK